MIFGESKLVVNTYIGYFRSNVRSKRYFSSSIPGGIANRHKRRARVQAAFGCFNDADISQLVRESQYQCYWCDKDVRELGMHIDHHIPLYLGGPNIVENLNISCAPCNLSKNATDPIVFAQKNRRPNEHSRVKKILSLCKAKYEDYLDKVKNKPSKNLTIRVAYLDILDCYGFMCSKFEPMVAKIFSNFNRLYPTKLYFNKYNSGSGQDVWCVDSQYFEPVLEEIYLLEKQVNFNLMFIRWETKRGQRESSSEKFLEPVFYWG